MGYSCIGGGEVLWGLSPLRSLKSLVSNCFSPMDAAPSPIERTKNQSPPGKIHDHN